MRCKKQNDLAAHNAFIPPLKSFYQKRFLKIRIHLIRHRVTFTYFHEGKFLFVITVLSYLMLLKQLGAANRKGVSRKRIEMVRGSDGRGGGGYIARGLL